MRHDGEYQSKAGVREDVLEEVAAWASDSDYHDVPVPKGAVARAENVMGKAIGPDIEGADFSLDPIPPKITPSGPR